MEGHDQISECVELRISPNRDVGGLQSFHLSLDSFHLIISHHSVMGHEYEVDKILTDSYTDFCPVYPYIIHPSLCSCSELHQKVLFKE